jgi:hypothetical protein
MRGVSKARENRDQIVSAIQVLEQLIRHIDDEAEKSIRSTGKWHLEANRADWIASQGVQRMQAVDTVIRELNQCTFAVENSSRT